MGQQKLLVDGLAAALHLDTQRKVSGLIDLPSSELYNLCLGEPAKSHRGCMVEKVAFWKGNGTPYFSEI